MADLYFTDEMLQRIETTLATMERVLERPARAMQSATLHDLGRTRLTLAVEEFSDAWAYGIDELGRCSAEAVEALDDIRLAFITADEDLAAELNNDKPGPLRSADGGRSTQPAWQPSANGNPLPTGPPWPTWPAPATGGRSAGP
ncbi:hypothetical protein [Aeromicrobium fastidiosum]|uniref:Uncharacterized protein n=1 Tax=Aeromicrobium fastidiosum TaxID=52699 RepID=A0A641AJP4_9ACTN|nr:hypothetical protein [Aeromicrobium fastidiosum]KAA1374938.1 hypothetical protein ESP62_016350 [Aeromicrobium fastidiosum]MBP2390488.1 hypothetical protein [Aeromicrobium fastidiosum]